MLLALSPDFMIIGSFARLPLWRTECECGAAGGWVVDVRVGQRGWMSGEVWGRVAGAGLGLAGWGGGWERRGGVTRWPAGVRRLAGVRPGGGGVAWAGWAWLAGLVGGGPGRGYSLACWGSPAGWGAAGWGRGCLGGLGLAGWLGGW